MRWEIETKAQFDTSWTHDAPNKATETLSVKFYHIMCTPSFIMGYILGIANIDMGCLMIFINCYIIITSTPIDNCIMPWGNTNVALNYIL